MKAFLMTCVFFWGGMTTLSAATLEASSTQPTYPGSATPRLSIVSGSGKTSYVSGTIDDPTDPAATAGIYFNAPTGSKLKFSSSSTSVVKVSDITAEEIQTGLFAVRIKPSGVGTTEITVSLDGASDYHIQYAASKASATPSVTRWFAGSSDASAIASVGDGYFFVADDENNILRLYNSAYSGMPIREIDATSMAGGSSSEEFDIEGATVSEDGKTIYWLTSLSNSKKGKEKPYRNRAFSTKLSGSGVTATLAKGAYTQKMRDALIAFGDKNKWDFTSSASFEDKVIPKRIDGFNIEGLTLQKGGGGAYIGFRAPCVPLKGVTPTSSNRKYALIAPVSNFEAMLSGSGESKTAPQVGEPILFDFGGLGIRSIERVGDYYVIVGGLFEGGGKPKAYLWDGTTPANSSPLVPGDGHLTEMNIDMSDLVQVSGDDADGHPEALVARQEGNNIIIDLVCDDGSMDFYNDGTTAKTLSADSKKYPWAKFRLDTFVYAIPTPTGISSAVMQPSLGFSVIGNQLHVNGLHAGMPVTVVTVDGVTVATAVANGDTCSLTLPERAATYIVKAGNRVVKFHTHQ